MAVSCKHVGIHHHFASYYRVYEKVLQIAATFWILTPLWLEQLDGWFRWAKTLSVLIPTAMLVGIARIANYEKKMVGGHSSAKIGSYGPYTVYLD
jgi:hypothetical protein